MADFGIMALAAADAFNDYSSIIFLFHCEPIFVRSTTQTIAGEVLLERLV